MATKVELGGEGRSAAIGAAPDVDRAVNAWFVYLMTERQLAAHTVEAYRRDLSQFLGFLAGHLGRLPDLKLLLVAVGARRARLSRRAPARRTSAAGACRGP